MNITTIPAYMANYKPRWINATHVSPAGPNSSHNPMTAREIANATLNRKVGIQIPVELSIAAAHAKRTGNMADYHRWNTSIQNVVGSALLQMKDEAVEGTLWLEIILERLTEFDNPIPNYKPYLPPKPPGTVIVPMHMENPPPEFDSSLFYGFDKPEGNPSELTLAEILAQAIEEYRNRILMGLNALTEEEIQEKLQQFKAFFMPQDGTEEEMREFFLKLGEFERMLRDMAANGHREGLINFGASTQDDEAVPGVPFLQQRLDNESNITPGRGLNPRLVSERYERLLSGENGSA